MPLVVGTRTAVNSSCQIVFSLLLSPLSDSQVLVTGKLLLCRKKTNNPPPFVTTKNVHGNMTLV